MPPLGGSEGRKLEWGRVISTVISRIHVLESLCGFATAAWIRKPFNLLLIKMILIYFVSSSAVPRHLTRLWLYIWNAKSIFMWCWGFALKLRMKKSFTLLFSLSIFRTSVPHYNAAFQALWLCMFDVNETAAQSVNMNLPQISYLNNMFK